MKAVLISIKPKYSELIADGIKTVEIRKTKPKLTVSFKVYIYETKGKVIQTETYPSGRKHKWYEGSGKIIGEFICDKVYQYTTYNRKTDVDISDDDIQRMSCLTKQQIAEYEEGTIKDFCLSYYGVYGWHISNLIIYDKPKNLYEFKQCHKCEYYASCKGQECSCDGKYNMNRAPQSWCYVTEH